MTPLAEEIAFVVSCPPYKKARLLSVSVIANVSQHCVCSVCGKRVHVTVDSISPLLDINSWVSNNLLSLNIDKTYFMQVVTKNSSLIDSYITH